MRGTRRTILNADQFNVRQPYPFPVDDNQPIVPMNLVHQNGHRYLLSASRAELIGIANSLNEVCNGVNIEDPEFETRLGFSRERLRAVLASVNALLGDKPGETFETVAAWADGCSVQARCMGAYGDPVDMSSGDAREFASLLIRCADKADSIL